MRILLQKLTMVKGLQETACVRSAVYSNYPRNAGYREAVKALNLLQTNASVLQEVRKKRKQGLPEKNDKLLETYRYLNRSGVSLDELDSLPIIHVAGTKGKGSTCAFCESILRHWGMKCAKQTWKKNGEVADGLKRFRTGLYTSPHLVEVRERIQLDGKPISRELFALYFWNVYDILMEKREYENDMPPYFKFLTVLAFNVFIKERVDVAVVEVGIGGEYDCTNVIRKPVAVGITSLGIDHTSILGDTLEEIAWQKAGILKEGAPAFTASDQVPAALAVLQERAREKEVNLKECPPFSSYLMDELHFSRTMSMYSKIQEINASLALQLANAWIKWHQNSTKNGCVCTSSDLPMASPFKVDLLMSIGLKKCRWPGRAQVLHLPSCLYNTTHHKFFDDDMSVTFFLDGAHTSDSIQLCLDWFKHETYMTNNNGAGDCHLAECSEAVIKDNPNEIVRVLLFNTTGDRDVEELLAPLAKSNLFQVALFSTNSTTLAVDPHSDLTNFSVYQDQQKYRCEEHLKVWLKYNNCIPAQVFLCVADALSSLKQLTLYQSPAKSRKRNVHILVSGSLHLVGSVLSIVDPNLSSSYPSDDSGDSDAGNSILKSPEKSQMSTSGSSSASIQCDGARRSFDTTAGIIF